MKKSGSEDHDKFSWLSEDEGGGGEAYKEYRGKVNQELDGRNTGISILNSKAWPFASVGASET